MTFANSTSLYYISKKKEAALACKLKKADKLRKLKKKSCGSKNAPVYTVNW
jgi:hypothetical protein